jgi:hypothetical protein
VYHPMAQAFVAYKAKDDPLPFVLEVQASDWRNYTVEWLQRRTATKE